MCDTVAFMVAISRVKVEFSGSAVTGPAASSFYTTGQVQNLRNPLVTLWTALRLQMPPTLTVTIPTTGEVFDSVTGDLTDTWSTGTPVALVGTGAGGFAAGVGARLVWKTAGVTNNRRVRGSTFVVPLTIAVYGADGTIDNAVVADWKTKCSDFTVATTTDLVIWTRPRGGTPGKVQGVTGSDVPDRVSTLRSRRT